MAPPPLTAREREALNASADGATVATWLSLWESTGRAGWIRYPARNHPPPAWRPSLMTHTSTDRPAARASGALVPVLAFMGIVVSVMQTLLVPVIKELPQLLGTEPGNATWVITSTLLSGAVATPIMGRLGDLHGKRRMLILSLAVMVVGALVSALTSDLLTMIAGRTLQGFAMSAIPLGIGLTRDILPARSSARRWP